MTTTTDAAPVLATGWEPELPLDDSLLRRYLHAWADLCDAFATAAGGRGLRSHDLALTDYRTPAGWSNAATLLRPPSDVDAVLDRVERWFAGGRGEAHLWSAWPLPDLRGRGWERVGHPPLLVRPPAAVLPVPPASRTVRVVRDAAALAAWERVAVDGYPLPELAGSPTGALADPRLLTDPRLRLTVGADDAGRPASLGSLFTAHGLAVFALGVTLPTARGRGHWQAHAVDRLRAAPDVWAAGVFSDVSRPLAERLGFVPLLRLDLWALPRPA